MVKKVNARGGSPKCRLSDIGLMHTKKTGTFSICLDMAYSYIILFMYSLLQRRVLHGQDCHALFSTRILLTRFHLEFKILLLAATGTFKRLVNPLEANEICLFSPHP